MLSLYGRQWETSYGQIDGAVYHDWMQSLVGLTEKQVGNGLTLLMEEGNEFPPNLIKFIKLCKTPKAPKPTIFKALPTPPRKFSTMRIERAKQKAICGSSFDVNINENDMIMDWTDEDDAALMELIDQWDVETGLDGLNQLIDSHKFSRGY